MISNSSLVKNTTHKAVIPFYAYAAFSFLVATILLVLSSKAFGSHYFQPPILAVTHTMALGWGTMMILGASHQLFPVLI
ncbi:MAG: cytochrome C oxidase subunit I, partial [Bacteroidetes bacterium]|nr:cytochrome C oxidase subunit I [Bacteroidota bacterium]